MPAALVILLLILTFSASAQQPWTSVFMGANTFTLLIQGVPGVYSVTTNGTSGTSWSAVTNINDAGSAANRLRLALAWSNTAWTNTLMKCYDNGIEMTAIAWTNFNTGSTASNNLMKAWYLVNPSSGSGTVIFTNGGATGRKGMIVATLTNCSQTVPIGTVSITQTTRFLTNSSVESSLTDLNIGFSVIYGGGGTPNTMTNGVSQVRMCDVVWEQFQFDAGATYQTGKVSSVSDVFNWSEAKPGGLISFPILPP